MKLEAVTVPDLGGATDVEVIELGVAVGAMVAVDQALITLETDKASMDMPSPLAGTVREMRVKVGDRVKQGDIVLMLEVAGEVGTSPPVAAAVAPASSTEVQPPSQSEAQLPSQPEPAAPPAAAGELAIVVPDLGGAANVEVIEVSVKPGDRVAEGAALLVMEGDKASMELPAPASGTILSLDVRVGGQLNGGQQIGTMRPDAAPATTSPAASAPRAEVPAAAVEVVPPQAATATAAEGDAGLAIARVLEKERKLNPGGAAQRAAAKPEPTYAGPAVRQLARELGVRLEELRGGGPKGRVLKEDVQAYVKARLAAPAREAGTLSLPAVPEVDFAAFGPIEMLALTNTQKATVTNMSRSWLNVPHVTQMDFADVDNLEAFRESLKPEMEQRGNKLTPLPFLLLACARALQEHPRFNSSLGADGAHLVMKKYCHIGIAVDTPQGLVVPVIRDVDRKNLWDLAAEARELAGKARSRKLKLADMQGACFTISSLGNIGGEGFTPIVNTPEVAILGVSKLAVRPVWDGKAFQPRKTLPLSLSYDHRVINGADAGSFLTYLVSVLGDLRRLLL